MRAIVGAVDHDEGAGGRIESGVQRLDVRPRMRQHADVGHRHAAQRLAPAGPGGVVHDQDLDLAVGLPGEAGDGVLEMRVVAEHGNHHADARGLDPARPAIERTARWCRCGRRRAGRRHAVREGGEPRLEAIGLFDQLVQGEHQRPPQPLRRGHRHARAPEPRQEGETERALQRPANARVRSPDEQHLDGAAQVAAADGLAGAGPARQGQGFARVRQERREEEQVAFRLGPQQRGAAHVVPREGGAGRARRSGRRSARTRATSRRGRTAARPRGSRPARAARGRTAARRSVPARPRPSCRRGRPSPAGWRRRAGRRRRRSPPRRPRTADRGRGGGGRRCARTPRWEPTVR